MAIILDDKLTRTATLMPTFIEVLPTGHALGADIAGLDISKPLTEEEVSIVRQAWDNHLVLRLRGQTKASLDDLISFSRNFGTLDKRPIASGALAESRTRLPDEITVISNVKIDGKPIGGLGDSEAAWHADMTYKDVPPKGACLHAIEIPPQGGDTHFANMYAAFDALPPELARAVEGRSCIHDASRNSAGELRTGFTDPVDPRQTVGAVHPLVSVHQGTGKKCLFLGRRRNAYIVGMSLDESESLLDALWAHATRPEFTWSQVWQEGDIMMWDNTCTMHRRDSFDANTRRLMYRTQFA